MVIAIKSHNSSKQSPSAKYIVPIRMIKNRIDTRLFLPDAIPPKLDPKSALRNCLPYKYEKRGNKYKNILTNKSKAAVPPTAIAEKNTNLRLFHFIYSSI